MRIRTNDVVEVITGDEKGSRGKVLRVDLSGGKVVVEGVNKVWKHVHRSQKNPQGGRLSKEMPIAVSNVLLVCTACNRPARIGVRILADGSKARICKKCKANLGPFSPPKERRAKLAAPPANRDD